MFTSIIDLINQAPDWVAAVTAIFMGLKMFTALTPSTSDNEVVDKVLKFLNILALNVFKDKNEDSDVYQKKLHIGNSDKSFVPHSID